MKDKNNTQVTSYLPLAKRLIFLALMVIYLLLRKVLIFKRNKTSQEHDRLIRKQTAEQRFNRILVSFAADLKAIMGDKMYRKLLKNLLYENNKQLKVLKTYNQPHTNKSIGRAKHHTRTMPDRSRETFVKIGKTSPGLSPP